MNKEIRSLVLNLILFEWPLFHGERDTSRRIYEGALKLLWIVVENTVDERSLCHWSGDGPIRKVSG